MSHVSAYDNKRIGEATVAHGVNRNGRSARRNAAYRSQYHQRNRAAEMRMSPRNSSKINSDNKLSENLNIAPRRVSAAPASFIVVVS